MPPANAPIAERATEKKILEVLDRMVKSYETYLSVPIQDGHQITDLATQAPVLYVAFENAPTG